jgi:NAD(P)-dependent dehydrogenase (short-subunit alcohol dehydrogenase family)
MPRSPKNLQPSHALTGDAPRATGDRPMGGAVYPATGTIVAPVVVVGASGTIGREIVRLLAAAGRPVVIVGPDHERLHALAAELPRGLVTILAGHIVDDDGAAELAAQLRALDRPVAGVINAFPTGKAQIDGGDRGRALEQPVLALRECLNQTVLAQLALARHLIPLLAETGRNGRYVIIGGPGSESPWAGYGQRSIAMAATRMLAQVLHDEAQPLGVRVHLVSIDAPVRSDEPRLHECPEWPTARDIAHRAVQLLEHTQTVETAGAVITCGRGVAHSVARFTAQTFRGVPAFLESLKKATPK